MMDSSGSVVKPMGIKGHEEEVYNVEREGKPLNLGPVVDMVLEQVRTRVNINNTRSLFSCIGVGEAQPFTVPQGQHQMLMRLKTNGNFFLTNYLLAAVVVFAFLLLFFHPIQLLVCILVGFGWYIVLTKKHNELDHLVIMGKRIGEEHLLLFTTGATIIFLVFFILPTILFSFSTSALGCAAHALLRNNRLKNDDSRSTLKPNSKIEEAEDLV